MPVCRTCMGEYARQEALCPYCGKSLGRGVNLCHQCGAETGGKRLCPRCKSDVSVWEQENTPLLLFVLRRALYALIPIIIVAVAFFFFRQLKGETLHHWVTTVVAVVCSFLAIVLLCMKRLFWWERWWTSEVYAKNSFLLSLSFLMACAFLLAIVCGVTCVVLYELWQAPIRFEQKLFFGLFYVAFSVSSTSGLALLAIHSYVAGLDERAPQPLFVNTEHLVQVVVETATKTLHVSDDRGNDPPHPREEPVRTHEILDVARNRQTGGVHVMFRECEQVVPSEGLTTTPPRWSEKTWSVDADRWGRVLSLNPVWQELDKKH